MFTILLHSSKTMRQDASQQSTFQKPILIEHSLELMHHMIYLSADDIRSVMKVSETKAVAVQHQLQQWTTKQSDTRAAIDSFTGDIYSGLQVGSLSSDDRQYANQSLYILSGLYGVLKALDSISSYRLEMGYKLPFPDLPSSLYSYWGDVIANQLPAKQTIINLSSIEYTKAVFPHLDTSTRVISPKFMSVNQKTGEPAFVVVHAKIARGAFAHWLITRRIEATSDVVQFTELGYRYNPALSTPDVPVFVCDKFGGIGLSVRLSS